MPIWQMPDGLHTRRVDLVASTLRGGPCVIADVVTTDVVDPANPRLSASRAGHAAANAARCKAAKCADHPAGDEFIPLAVVHGALGSQWLDLLARLARRAVSRRRGKPADSTNAAGSWAQVYCMRLSISHERSMAHALHLRAGRALAAASGFRQGNSFPAASLSDLRLLTPLAPIVLTFVLGHLAFVCFKYTKFHCRSPPACMHSWPRRPPAHPGAAPRRLILPQ
eukprot:SM000066S20462  [mRNA]  locus=s66:456567:457354:+ [translate_table: standard]